MAQLLLEFLSEEIPARMQVRAEGDLERLLSAALKEAGLKWESLTTFSGPRRLGLLIEGLPVQTDDVREERKGPRTDAPEKALEGFMRGAGVASLDQCETRTDKKGEFYVAVIEKPGRKTADVVAEAIPALVKDFPWPKSMKFGEGAKAQRWVRPLQRVLCLLDGAVVPFEVFGIATGNTTEGHRVMGRGPFTVTDFADYEETLRTRGAVLTHRAERETLILEGARKVCADAGLELIEDAGLLAEVTGLVETPVPLLGQMDPDFLDLPPEVIQLTMKTHQKYFAVRDPKTSAIAPNFVVIANQVAPDGGTAIAAGNARVLSARLSDARHFWDNDRKRPLDEMAKELSKVTFHEKLGSVADKVERVAALARELAPAVGADPDLAERAARLSKADLVSEMVYEFPELQGAMGRYYALEQGEPAEVADAIRDHYKPQGPSDAVPTAPVSAAVALADKLDTLVGFWAIDEKPTGSKDPFALRRAALGFGRILISNNIRISLSAFTRTAYESILSFQAQKLSDWIGSIGLEPNDKESDFVAKVIEEISSKAPSAKFLLEHQLGLAGRLRADLIVQSGDVTTIIEFKKGVRSVTEYADKISAYNRAYLHQNPESTQIATSLQEYRSGFSAGLSAFAAERQEFDVDRLKVVLKDEGVRFDVIDAVFALGDDDLVRVTNRARALQTFLETEDGAALLAGYKRAANILKAEEKKDDAAFAADMGEGALEDAYLSADRQPQEIALAEALSQAGGKVEAMVSDEDFEGAMAALSTLRAPVDAFFDAVTVNSDDAMLRRNRLRLLAAIRMAAHAVADFGKIEG